MAKIVQQVDESKRQQRSQPQPESDLVEIKGPTISEDYHLIVDGYQVPYIKLRRLKNNDEPTALDAMESWQVLIDDRLSAVVTKSELNTWGYILANAMAVAAGYTSHGSNSRPINRHGPPSGNPVFSHHHWTVSSGGNDDSDHTTDTDLEVYQTGIRKRIQQHGYRVE